VVPGGGEAQQREPIAPYGLNEDPLNEDLLNEDLLNEDLLNEDLLNEDLATSAAVMPAKVGHPVPDALDEAVRTGSPAFRG
jgi:hypothetical protein